MQAACLALAFLLLSQPGFCIWNQSVAVKAVDLNGAPVSDATVKIAYQEFNAINTDKDALLVGKTGGDGIFSANISNKVAGTYENRIFDVSLGTYYWDGEKKSRAAHASGATAITFTVPVELRNIAVHVSGIGGQPVQNASVTVAGSDIVKATGADGIAKFSLPGSGPFSGFVFYGGELAGQFSSGNMEMENGTQSISVPLSAFGNGAGGAGHGKILLGILFTEMNGTPLSGQAVSFSYAGGASTRLTDSSGRALFTLDRNGTLSMSLRKHDHDYNFTYSITIQNGTPASIERVGTIITFNESGTDMPLDTTLALYPVLVINSLSAQEESENCFAVFANVTDPRTSVPLQVQMSKASSADPAAFSDIQTSLDDMGLYYSQLCIKSDTIVRVAASNRYEATSAAISIAHATHAPSAPPAPQLVPDRTKEMVAGACTACGLIGLVLLYIYGRRNFALLALSAKIRMGLFSSRSEFQEKILRPIIEYLRVLRRTMGGRRGL